MEYFDAVLPGFGLRVSYGGRKTFFVTTRIDRRQRRFTLGPYPMLSLVEARQKARGVLEDAARGIDPNERQRSERQQSERRRRNTFGAIAGEFMEDHAKNFRTRSEYQRQLDVDLLPHWRETPITEITRGDIRTLLRNKAATAPVAANRLQALLSSLFNWAVDEEIVAANPAARLRSQIPEVDRERVLTASEIRSIWKATELMGYPFGAVYQMLLATGQRRGEVGSMRWTDIDGDVWRLPGEAAKSGRGHAVPLSSLAIEILEAVPRMDGVSRVFVSGRAGDTMLSGWSKTKKRCDRLCGVKNWRVHDFRRTAATNMRELGVDRLTVSKVLNRAESGITQVYDRYAEDGEKSAALESWAVRLRSIVAGDGGAANVVGFRSRTGSQLC